MPAHSTASGTDLHEALRTKQPVRAASTANVTLASPGASMDGVTLSSGDRVLLKNQTAPAENGPYVWTGSGSTLTRTTDADAAADFVHLFQVGVREGTVNGATNWTFTQSAAITLGATALTFAAAGGDPTTTRGDMIYRAASALARLAVGTVGKFIGSDGTDPVWTNSVAHLAATGLTGAVTATRYVGGTASVAPTTGTFSTGDWVISTAGRMWICTAGGSPGTWVQAVSFAPSGLTGATGATRYAGGTTFGPPTTGTFVIGDVVPDQLGSVWLCVSSGSPGTWMSSSQRIVAYASGAAFGQTLEYKQLHELVTVAAAATTVTSIQLPAGAIMLGIPMRTTTAIPTATTYTVTGDTSGTLFNTGASVSSGTGTNKGTQSCPYYNPTLQSFRITPDATPATNAGRVRLCVFYYETSAPSA